MSDAKKLLGVWGLNWQFDNTMSKQVLGIEYEDISRSVNDMTYSMFASGALEDKRNGKSAKGTSTLVIAGVVLAAGVVAGSIYLRNKK